MSLVIDFNYYKTIEQVKELRSISKALANLGEKDLSACLGKISKNWKGDNADAYIKKAEKLEGYISDSSKNISDTADVLEEMATNLYNAEKENEKIAAD